MKKFISALLVAVLFVSTAVAQSKVTEKEVLGTWKLHIDLDKEIQKENSEMGFLDKMVLGAVSGIVSKAMEHVDIRFNFKKNHEAILTVHVEDEDKHEEEVLNWFINSKGQLEIDDINNEKVNINSEGVWMMKGTRLVVVEEEKSTEAVYLERVQ